MIIDKKYIMDNYVNEEDGATYFSKTWTLLRHLSGSHILFVKCHSNEFLHKALSKLFVINIFNFEKVFSAVTSNMILYNECEVMFLYKVLLKLYLFTSNRNYLDLGIMIYKCHTCSYENRESDIEFDIIEHWGEIFPQYRFIERQHKIKFNGVIYKIDIFAHDDLNDRDVIIEVKRNNKNTTSQLLKYKRFYPDAKLISINHGDVINKSVDIQYFTYEYDNIQMKEDKDFTDIIVRALIAKNR